MKLLRKASGIISNLFALILLYLRGSASQAQITKVIDFTLHPILQIEEMSSRETWSLFQSHRFSSKSSLKHQLLPSLILLP